MNVLICWSGMFSRAMAKGVVQLLEDAFPAGKAPTVTAIFSDQIQKGAFWVNELEGRLRQADAGIVCLTPENLEGAWIHFESGALALKLVSKSAGSSGATLLAPSERRLPIYPLLYEVTPAQIQGPLAAYQATPASQQDILALLESIAALAGADASMIQSSGERHLEASQKFMATLEQKLFLSKVEPNFGQAFHRMTFDEPVQQCMSQRWLDRLEGALETEQSTRALRSRLGPLCTADDAELLVQLEGALRQYADAIGSLLIEQRRYSLDGESELAIEPKARRALEMRRLKVKAIVDRIRDLPTAAPKTPDAIRYFGAETFDERKLIIHRLESRIRTHWDVGTPATLPPGSALQYRGSSWDLDRIHYYLDEEYRSWATEWQPSREEVSCMIYDVEIEMERAVAGARDDSSLMTVGYALGPLKKIPVADPDLREKALRVLEDVSTYVAQDPDGRDPGSRLRRLIEEVRHHLEQQGRESDARLR